ncbi:MAG: major capsid protein [Dehalococcoidia bacterium]
MALTLTEAAKLSNNIVLQGIVETIVKESPILQILPFIDINGNALVYNQENTLPAANFYNVGDTWNESTPTFTQQTATLAILGGDADVDQYIQQTRTNIQDIEAVVIELKAKAVRIAWENSFLNGPLGGAGVTPGFNGIDYLCAAPQIVTAGTGNGGPLTLSLLDQLIDLVRPGKPDLLLLSRRTRRTLTQLVRASGAFIESEVNNFGLWQQYYNGIPVGVSDYINDGATVGTSSNCSTIYAMQFGEGRIAGLQGAGGLQVERVGPVQTKDAIRWRIKWYSSVACFGTLCLAKLNGLTPS